MIGTAFNCTVINFDNDVGGMTGGVTAVTADQMSLVNGFSNMYIGWGLEGNKIKLVL